MAKLHRTTRNNLESYHIKNTPPRLARLAVQESQLLQQLAALMNELAKNIRREPNQFQRE